jgi:hypothetical protein
MSPSSNWTLDFCLFCDKQTHSEEPYCSQACRLADLEKPGFPPPAASASSASSRSSAASHFHLPPPFNFEPYRHQSSRPDASPPLSPTAQKSSRPKLPSRSSEPQHSQHRYAQQQQQRSLNSSSSRSSLSSVSSANSAQGAGLSEVALAQLQGYANAFDHVRDARRYSRRITLG